MNAELIKRTSKAIASCKNDAPILKAVLIDCKAEIELLTDGNESLRNQNTALDAECARLESALLPHDVKTTLINCQRKRIAELEAELQKAREYVPIDEDYIRLKYLKYYDSCESIDDWIETIRKIERVFVKRAGLIVVESKP